jgi:hypothetical protein
VSALPSHGSLTVTRQSRWLLLGLRRWGGCYPSRRSHLPMVRCQRKMRQFLNQRQSLRYRRLLRLPVASTEIVQQLEPMARDLAAVQRSLEQLAVKQDQMAQSIATLRTVEQDIKQKLASRPTSRAVPTPPRKPPQPSMQSPAAQSSSMPPPPPATQQPLPLH